MPGFFKPWYSSLSKESTLKQIRAGISLLLSVVLLQSAMAQEEPPVDPYGDPILTVDDIDEELFIDIVEEIILDEDEEFVNIVGEEISYNPISGIRTFENMIDLPAQFENSFVHNEKVEEVRAIYTLGPSDELDRETAKAWYEGLVKLVKKGNETREWDMTIKTEEDVAGLPERTTFFLFADDYSDTYIEVYYTAHRNSGSRVNILFIFPL